MNPPQIPTARNNVHFSDWQDDIIKPIKNDPIIFVTNVPKIEDELSNEESSVIP